MNTRFKYITTLVLSVAGLLFILEGVSYLVLNKIYNRKFDESLIVENKYQNSSGLKENATGKVWGKFFHTDENGTRKHRPPHSKSKRNWLYVGDSVTEGVGVEDTSTFASLSADEFVDYNVINYSLIGYSTADYWNVLSSVLSQDSNVELVTLFYCLNDVYGSSAKKDLPTLGKQNLIGKLNGILQRVSSLFKLIKLSIYQHSNRYFQYDEQFYLEGGLRFGAATCQLYACDSLCKANNIFFQVVALPYRSQLGTKNFKPQQLLKTFCSQNEIAFSDAADALQKSGDPSSLYLFGDEIHLSEKGHKAIAEFLSR